MPAICIGLGSMNLSQIIYFFGEYTYKLIMAFLVPKILNVRDKSIRVRFPPRQRSGTKWDLFLLTNRLIALLIQLWSLSLVRHE